MFHKSLPRLANKGITKASASSHILISNMRTIAHPSALSRPLAPKFSSAVTLDHLTYTPILLRPHEKEHLEKKSLLSSPLLSPSRSGNLARNLSGASASCGNKLSTEVSTRIVEMVALAYHIGCKAAEEKMKIEHPNDPSLAWLHDQSSPAFAQYAAKYNQVVQDFVARNPACSIVEDRGWSYAPYAYRRTAAIYYALLIALWLVSRPFSANRTRRKKSHLIMSHQTDPRGFIS